MLLALPSHHPSAVKRTVHVVAAMPKGFGLQRSGSGFEFPLFVGTYIRCVHRSEKTDLPTSWLYEKYKDCSLSFSCELNLARDE